MEIMMMLAVVAIMITIVIAVVLTFGGKAKSSINYSGEILNATMVYSPANYNIGPGNLSDTGNNVSEYLLIATNYPLPTIPKNESMSKYVFVQFSSIIFYSTNVYFDDYNQGNVTELYSQNGEYVYAFNFTGYTSSYNIPIVSLSNILIFYNNNNITLVAVHNPLKVNFVETNSSYFKISPIGNIGKNQTENATFIITGLPLHSNITFSYFNFSQGFFGSQTTGNIIINSSTVIKTINAPPYPPETSSVPSTVSYNGVTYYTAINSSNYTAGSTISYKYHTLSTAPIKYTLNKPIVNGAEVTFTLPNSTYYYPKNPFSNLEVSVGNTIANGGTQISAFVANYTPASITLNLGNIPSNNIESVYLNFLPAGTSGTDVAFSSEYLSTNPGANFTPSTGINGIFASYNDNGGSGFSPTSQIVVTNSSTNPPQVSFNSILITSSAKSNTEYVAGINIGLGGVASFGFSVNQTNLDNTNLGALQAPYPGIYAIGSSNYLFLNQSIVSSSPSTGLFYSQSFPYVGEIGLNYNIAGNTLVVNANANGESETYSHYTNVATPLYLYAFQKEENLLYLYYIATAGTTNIYGYTVNNYKVL